VVGERGGVCERERKSEEEQRVKGADLGDALVLDAPFGERVDGDGDLERRLRVLW
jgi:hypothetical protein